MQRLGALIRERRDEILARWTRAVRTLPHASTLDTPRLVNHIPELLDRIAQMMPGKNAITQHAIERIEEGFGLLEVIDEYGALHDVAFDVFRESDEQLGVDELSVLDRAIHSAIKDSVDHYSRARERQLAESERQLRALADNIPQLAWMADAQGAIYWLNAGWYAYTGLTPDEMKGEWKPRVHHPDHFERVERQWEEAIAAGTPWEDTLALRGRDGHFRWFLSRAVPIRDATGKIERWFGTNTDVTAGQFLDHATRVLNSSLDYRETFEQLARLAVPDLADWCIVDLIETTKLEHVAIAHVDATKLQLAREYARTTTEDPQRDPGTRAVMRTGVPSIVAEITDEMLASGAQSPEHLRLLRALGFKSWIGAPLIARGQTFGLIHLVMSESGRRYSGADLEIAGELGRRAGAAVDNARLYRKAQDAVRVRDDVLAIVSHDLRNPLGTVDLAATLLQQMHGSDERERKHIESIRRSVDRMTHLIDDLLDMASINAGRFSIHPSPVDAGEVVREALDLHDPVASERGIAIQRVGDVDGVLLHADRNRLIQVFGNLLGNAIKFCKSGDVITARAVRDGDRVRFSISDTGPGIAQLELPHIFEPYWSGRGRKKGTGLGLYITKAIVEAHGGTIEVASEEGKGATLVVTLPVAG